MVAGPLELQYSAVQQESALRICRDGPETDPGLVRVGLRSVFDQFHPYPVQLRLLHVPAHGIPYDHGRFRRGSTIRRADHAIALRLCHHGFTVVNGRADRTACIRIRGIFKACLCRDGPVVVRAVDVLRLDPQTVVLDVQGGFRVEHHVAIDPGALVPPALCRESADSDRQCVDGVAEIEPVGHVDGKLRIRAERPTDDGAVQIYRSLHTHALEHQRHRLAPVFLIHQKRLAVPGVAARLVAVGQKIIRRKIRFCEVVVGQIDRAPAIAIRVVAVFGRRTRGPSRLCERIAVRMRISHAGRHIAEMEPPVLVEIVAQSCHRILLHNDWFCAIVPYFSPFYKGVEDSPKKKRSVSHVR